MPRIERCVKRNTFSNKCKVNAILSFVDIYANYQNVN